MSSVPFHYVDLRTFCYDTEDEKRVEAALRTYLPEGCELKRQVTTGHHGDRIVVLTTRLENADDVRVVLDRLVELPDYDTVLDELDDRVSEDCSLYLTLDKQAAFRGEPRQGDGITLRAKVEAYPAKRAAAVANAREALEARADR
ncbi:MAG: RNA-binding protein [Haloplanus sp.]